MPIVEEFKPDLVIISQVPDQEIYNYNYICICFLIPGLRRTERWPMPGRIWAHPCYLRLHDKGNAAKKVACLSNWLSLSVWWAWQTEGFCPCLREDTSLTRFASILCVHLHLNVKRPHLRLMQPGRHRRSRFSSCLGSAWWPPGWHRVSITQTPYQKILFSGNFNKFTILIILFQLQHQAQQGCFGGSDEHGFRPQGGMGVYEGAS